MLRTCPQLPQDSVCGSWALPLEVKSLLSHCAEGCPQVLHRRFTKRLCAAAGITPAGYQWPHLPSKGGVDGGRCTQWESGAAQNCTPPKDFCGSPPAPPPGAGAVPSTQRLTLCSLTLWHGHGVQPALQPVSLPGWVLTTVLGPRL